MEIGVLLLYILTRPVPFLVAAFTIIFVVKSYHASSYYASTGVPFLKLIFNKGKRGEYTVYRKLRKYEKDGAAVLTNLHIPNRKLNKITEIDAVMISRKGIFVFESKNYGGVIEPYLANPYEDWRQTIGYKHIQENYFNSPIRQNDYHIKMLSDFIERHLKIRPPYYSIIVFSNRCTLVNAKELDVPVVKVRSLKRLLAKSETMPDILYEEDIATITTVLNPFTERNIQNYNELNEEVSLTQENGKWRKM